MINFDSLNGLSKICDVTRNGLAVIGTICRKMENAPRPVEYVEMIYQRIRDMEAELNSIIKQAAVDRRSIAILLAWQFHGLPYRWGGDDPVAGFDCSGMIVEILKSVGILPRAGDWTAQGLWDQFWKMRVLDPGMGCLVFWQNQTGKVIHVEFCINHELAIGASGGGSATKTEQDAIDQNAYVKVRPFRSRSNIKGFEDPFKEDGP